MSGFSSAWLAMREPYDMRARSRSVLGAVTRAFSSQKSLNIVDLGSGTGSTYRALSPLLAARQNWRLIDNDPELLAGIERAENITPSVHDLLGGLDTVFEGVTDLVTTSALLDLTSEAWIDDLVRALSVRNLPFYAALSYDGRAQFHPAEPLDEKICAGFNRHQRTDKGFGPALGPDAAPVAIQQFSRAGYRIVQGQSDWTFATQDRDIQLEIVSGWAGAVREMGGLTSDEIESWLNSRRAAINAGGSRISVGHIDFFAVPIGSR